MKKRFIVDVTHRVSVYLDTTKFDEKLMKEFNETISDFGTDSDAYEEHAKHIARLAANGTDFEPHYFVEGYGYARDAGIDAIVHHDFDIDVVERGA